jgi:hypothetical protein
MCQDIALEARQKHEQGTPIAQIQEYIRNKFGGGRK